MITQQVTGPEIVFGKRKLGTSIAAAQQEEAGRHGGDGTVFGRRKIRKEPVPALPPEGDDDQDDAEPEPDIEPEPDDDAGASADVAADTATAAAIEGDDAPKETWGQFWSRRNKEGATIQQASEEWRAMKSVLGGEGDDDQGDAE